MRRVAVSAAMLALVLAGCGGDGGGDAAAVKAPGATNAGGKAVAVRIKTFIFNPDPVRVKAGQPVTFTNLDATKHTVTGEGFDKTLDRNGTFTHTFAKAGTYKYRCTLHSGDGMKGTVVVE